MTMLRIYNDVIEVIGALAPTVEQIRRRSPSLGDQLDRALDSVANNISEGSGSQGRNRRAHYYRALGSQYESRTCLESATARRWIAPVDLRIAKKIDGICAVLWKLTH